MGCWTFKLFKYSHLVPPLNCRSLRQHHGGKCVQRKWKQYVAIVVVIKNFLLLSAVNWPYVDNRWAFKRKYSLCQQKYTYPLWSHDPPMPTITICLNQLPLPPIYICKDHRDTLLSYIERAEWDNFDKFGISARIGKFQGIRVSSIWVAWVVKCHIEHRYWSWDSILFRRTWLNLGFRVKKKSNYLELNSSYADRRSCPHKDFEDAEVHRTWHYAGATPGTYCLKHIFAC